MDLIINDNILEENDSHRLSAFLRGDINLDNLDPKLKDLIEQYNAEIEPNSKHSSRVDSVARSSPSYVSNPIMGSAPIANPQQPYLHQDRKPALTHCCFMMMTKTTTPTMKIN